MAGQDANQNSLVAQRLDKLDAQIKENAEHLKEARAALLDSNSKIDVGIRQQIYNDLVAVQKELMAHLDKLSAHLCTAAAQRQAAPAGGGVLQFPQSPDEVQARTKYASRYAADIPAANGTDSATVVADDVIVTYAHAEHTSWQVGDIKEVHVHSTDHDRRRCVRAKVFLKTEGPNGPDIIALKVDPGSAGGVTVQGAVPDFSMYAGQPYILLGQSTQAQGDLTSTAHGSIAATEPDAYLHIRGDSQSGMGDCGGGVFAAESGKLIGVCVGNDERTKKSVIVPTAIILDRIRLVPAAV